VPPEPPGGRARHWLPRAAAWLRRIAPRPLPPPPAPPGRRILYVDDDDALVMLVTRLLARRGYAVDGFTRADEALAALRAAPRDYDLVITDLNMPGVSGLELAREVLRREPAQAVAVVSGYITEGLRDEAARLGVREVIYKPNTVDEMLATIHRMLASLHASRPTAAAPRERQC